MLALSKIEKSDEDFTPRLDKKIKTECFKHFFLTKVRLMNQL